MEILIKDLLQKVNNSKSFISHNAMALEIYEGDLHKYVYKTMESTLSANYFKTIKDRLIPINVLTRIIEKLAKVYAYPVDRKDGNYQEFIDEVLKHADLDDVMLDAEEISFLHKGYALEPYLDDDSKPKVRVLPYDRFLPLCEDKKDPMKMTGIIKIMGKVNQDEVLYHYWTNDLFIPFTSKGSIYAPDLIEGVEDFSNPLEFLPFVYGNRAKTKLIPTPDSDMLKLSQIIPIVLSDLGGAIMYQCFTILYGIDVNSVGLKMSPNAFWDIKSDQKSDKTPQIGTIKPEADVNKVLDFVRNIFTLWVETKGIKVGSVGTMDGAASASGIAKIIDEMDTSEVRKKSMKKLRKEESNLWKLLAKFNNYWLESEPNYQGTFIDINNLSPQIEYTEMKPQVSRKELFENTLAEFKEGFLDAKSAITKMYPELDGDMFNQRVQNLLDRSMIPRLEFTEFGEDGDS